MECPCETLCAALEERGLFLLKSVMVEMVEMVYVDNSSKEGVHE